MSDVPWIWAVILQVCLIALSAFLTGGETACLAADKNKLKEMSEKGNRMAERLLKVTSGSSRYLTVMKAAVTLTGFFSSTFASFCFDRRLIALSAGAGVEMSEAVAVIIIQIILVFFFLVFGDLVPRRMARNHPERYALSSMSVYRFFSVILWPLVALMEKTSNGVLRLMGVDPSAAVVNVTEEEIRKMVDAGSRRGTIDSDEQEMIQNVFEFDDIDADEICTRRMDVSIIWAEDSVEEWRDIINKSRHSLFPFCGESADEVLGIFDAKDFFRMQDATREEIISVAVKPAYFVPGSLKADVLFSDMQKSGRYFAVVLDEYGGMNGIITVKDLIEQVVGDIVESDETDRPEDIMRVTDRTWKIQGSASLDDVSEQLGIPLPVDEYDTFGGYIFGVIGNIPPDGSRFELNTDGLHIRVNEVRDHRITGTVVHVISEPKAEGTAVHSS